MKPSEELEHDNSSGFDSIFPFASVAGLTGANLITSGIAETLEEFSKAE
jgi:hypothetical protein